MSARAARRNERLSKLSGYSRGATWAQEILIEINVIFAIGKWTALLAYYR